MTSRARFRPLLTATTLALAACGSGGAANNADAPNNVSLGNEAAAPANQAAVAPAPAASATSVALSADYMVGKWSAVDEDCSGTLEFRKNGTVTTPIGDAKWTLTDAKLAIDYGDGSAPTRSSIKPLGPDRIEITTASGRKETEKRC